MTNPEDQLTKWVAEKHSGQLIRRTSEPYFNHLAAVALMSVTVLKLGYEIGLCHDLLEDTDTTTEELLATLLQLGYSHASAIYITGCVVELTDKFTKTAYPQLKKKKRKKMEAARLLRLSPSAQTVKYADLIYNAEWVLRYDLKQAGKYLLKKKRLLLALTEGDPSLREQAINVMDAGLRASLLI
jgi:(p)ppGpp synthase/HD superfamily hydrolase